MFLLIVRVRVVGEPTVEFEDIADIPMVIGDVCAIAILAFWTEYCCLRVVMMIFPVFVVEMVFCVSNVLTLLFIFPLCLRI